MKNVNSLKPKGIAFTTIELTERQQIFTRG